MEPPSFRKSRQRQVILDALSEMKSHPTALELFARVGEIDPQIGQATVYRNLRILKAQGEITELSFGPGAKRYDRNLTRHDHFTCRHCGKIEDIYPNLPNLHSLTGGLVADGYQVDQWRVEAFGICRDCAEKTKPTKPHRSAVNKQTKNGGKNDGKTIKRNQNA
ncbi:MAG: transcriptional repressor [Candidatus Manganitrophaceae bacterium]